MLYHNLSHPFAQKSKASNI